MSEYNNLEYVIKVLENNKSKKVAIDKLNLVDALINFELAKTKKGKSDYKIWRRKLIEVLKQEVKEHETIFDKLKNSKKKKKKNTVFDMLKGRRKHGF